MNETYTKMMLGQSLSKEADAAFYEKLELVQPKKRMNPILRAAVIAACLCLLIPVTVWAAESIFGFTQITFQKGKDFYGQDAIVLQTDIKNVEHIPITEFSQHLQQLKEYETVNFASWEEAEEAIGIDLISNNLLTAEGTHPHAGKNPKTKPFSGFYYAAEEQLFAVKFHASYFRNRIGFMINAFMTTDNPQMTEETFLVYHGFGEQYYDITDRISVEQFVTENGIPVTIYYSTDDDFGYKLPDAYFSVNNVSYHVSITQYGIEGDETQEHAAERAYALLREILEGFTVE